VVGTSYYSIFSSDNSWNIHILQL